MPEKSVREMSALERKHYSLAARTFHATVMGAAILGLVAFVIGLGLYTYALVGQYIGETFGLSRSAATVAEQALDSEALAADVMEIYRGLSPEERSGARTEEYRAAFAHLTERGDYKLLYAVLREFLKASDVNDVFFAVYDPDTSAIVYIVDPDEREGHICKPGDWEPVTEKEMNTFLNWDGEGKLYYISRRENYSWLCTSGVPVGDRSGSVRCFVMADLSLREVASGMKSFVILYTLALGVATFLLAYQLVRHMKKTLVEPINEIAQAAQEYVKDRRAGVRDTDHFTLLNIRTGDEVENLSLVMADMERDLTEYEENLTRITAEKERIGTELSLATKIQAAMLPHIFPAFPERKEFDIYASMDPAKEVGGDFYDFFLVDEDHLCLVMADVSGKGVPAALFMMASKIILQSVAMLGASPKEILSKTNEAICSNNQEEMFVTVWVGILEISTGKLTAANAGHEYPVLTNKPGAAFELVKDKHGFVIGGMEGSRYKEYELQLEPGTRLFLYTDGLPEATDAPGNMFGTERMLDALNAEPGVSPAQALANVRKAVDGFVKDAEQFDDLTMLCLEYIGPDKEKKV